MRFLFLKIYRLIYIRTCLLIILFTYPDWLHPYTNMADPCTVNNIAREPFHDE